MKKSVLLLFFAGCVATGIFGIGRKIPMNRVNDLSFDTHLQSHADW